MGHFGSSFCKRLSADVALVECSTCGRTERAIIIKQAKKIGDQAPRCSCTNKGNWGGAGGAGVLTKGASVLRRVRGYIGSLACLPSGCDKRGGWRCRKGCRRMMKGILYAARLPAAAVPKFHFFFDLNIVTMALTRGLRFMQIGPSSGGKRSLMVQCIKSCRTLPKILYVQGVSG